MYIEILLVGIIIFALLIYNGSISTSKFFGENKGIKSPPYRIKNCLSVSRKAFQIVYSATNTIPQALGPMWLPIAAPT